MLGEYLHSINNNQRGYDVAAYLNLQRAAVCVRRAVKPDKSNRRRRTAARVLSMPENSNKRRKCSMREKGEDLREVSWLTLFTVQQYISPAKGLIL